MHLSRISFALVLTAACTAGNTPDPQAPPGYNPGQFDPQGQGYGPAAPGQPYAPGAPQGYGYPQGGYAPQPGYAPQAPGYPPQYPPQAAPPAQPYAAPQPYPAYPQADPINNVDMDYLRNTARGVLGELVAALPPAAQARVAGIPFKTDPEVGEVNAYAACNEQHMPLMAITDGLLQTEAYVSQLRATDEIFGTRKLDSYLQTYAREMHPHQPIVAPPAGLIDPAQHVDPRKVARQHQLFEEQVAFVLGHELGHHHLGHTGCANGQSGDRAIGLGDLLRIGNKVIPVTNQVNEDAADHIGVDDVLAAGARRPGYKWTETGALLTISFFSQVQKSGGSLFTVLMSSHPNPQYRFAPIQQEAARFRATGQWFRPMLPLPG